VKEKKRGGEEKQGRSGERGYDHPVLPRDLAGGKKGGERTSPSSFIFNQKKEKRGGATTG